MGRTRSCQLPPSACHLLRLVDLADTDVAFDDRDLAMMLSNDEAPSKVHATVSEKLLYEGTIIAIGCRKFPDLLESLRQDIAIPVFGLSSVKVMSSPLHEAAREGISRNPDGAAISVWLVFGLAIAIATAVCWVMRIAWGLAETMTPAKAKEALSFQLASSATAADAAFPPLLALTPWDMLPHSSPPQPTSSDPSSSASFSASLPRPSRTIPLSVSSSPSCSDVALASPRCSASSQRRASKFRQELVTVFLGYHVVSKGKRMSKLGTTTRTKDLSSSRRTTNRSSPGDCQVSTPQAAAPTPPHPASQTSRRGYWQSDPPQKL
eukprot:CAMPEP_0180556748 /NCGR_PEP_ID=MMETSP1037_2-20121125/773_1 /TAXON_ID=632150 /ORGANISM="Azadinium spinosum, Strain 3D9" /LENGTH=321 /DNA_ID=CAMNT_0022572863 /DNA_START=1609 /DNA_END=2573 /DNA_ORIENTATION=-